MHSLDVEIRDLPPMSVVASQVTSEHPEDDAWRTLADWAEPAGLLEDATAHPVFGFNNPAPEPDRPLYGYEFWIAVDPGTESPPALERKEFPGGRYAVTTCRLLGDHPHGAVPEVWQQLLEWVEGHGYRWRQTHELERLVNPGAPPEEVRLELCLPIEAA